ncbi:MAG: hypothetical protein L0Y56_07880 [Nitrospira sp.]|nr:hypothetical protein [Nitrospira sp.]
MFKYLRTQLLNTVIAILAVGSFTGCGSSAGGGGSSSPPGLAGIEVKPNSTTLPVGDAGKQFSAEPKDTAGNTVSDEEIFWEIENNDGRRGSVNAAGWYRPPAVLPDSSNMVLVKAFSRKDPDKNGFASINLLTGPNLTFGTNVRASLLASGVDRTKSITDRSIAVFDKNVYVVWADADQAGNHHIYFAMSSNRGQSFGSAQRVDTAATGQQLSPKIAVGPQGDVYIVWYDSRGVDAGSDFDIFFAKGTISNGNISFSANIPVNDDINDIRDHFSPSIAVSANGNVYVAWEDSRENAIAADIYFAKGTAGAGGAITFSPNQRVNDLGGTNDLGNPSIAVDAQGNVYVSWVDFDNSYIYFDRGNENTSGIISFQTDVKVSDEQRILPLFPSLAVDHSNVYVSWVDFRNPANILDQGADIYIAKSENSGASFISNINVSNTLSNQYSPSLSIDVGGNLYLAWEDYRNGDADPDIYFVKSIDGGTSFGTHVRVNHDTGGAAQYSPSVALDSAGRAFLLWFDERDTIPSLYFAMGQ